MTARLVGCVLLMVMLGARAQEAGESSAWVPMKMEALGSAVAVKSSRVRWGKFYLGSGPGAIYLGIYRVRL